MRKKWIPKPLEYHIEQQQDGWLILDIYITEKNLLDWLAIAHVLLGEYVDAVVTPTAGSSMRLEIRYVRDGDSFLQISKRDRRVLLGLSRYHLEKHVDPYLCHYYLEGRAPGPLTDFEFPSQTSKVAGAEDAVVLHAAEYVPPMSAEEARKRILGNENE
jgi:hypothetical protein